MEHIRHFMFVHPRSTDRGDGYNTPGYFVVVDETPGLSDDDTFQIYWHPNSHWGHHAQSALTQDTNCSQIAPGTLVGAYHHRAIIDGLGASQNNDDVRLNFFFATQPCVVAHVKKKASAFDTRIDRDSLKADYRGNTRRALTVILPEDGTHHIVTGVPDGGERAGIWAQDNTTQENDTPAIPKALRATTKGYTSSAMWMGNGAFDVAAEFDQEQTHSLYGADVWGQFAVWRQKSARPEFYFVKNGRLFYKGGVGFAADAPVHIYMQGDAGKLKATGPTTLRFFGDGITGANLGGQLGVSSEFGVFIG